jgi:hypothetical protein
MGTSIETRVEVRTADGWTTSDLTALNDGNYGIYGFLADVRNYSHSPVIAEPRGLPDDVDMTAEEREDWADGWQHGASWLTLAELLAFDYEQVFWDRRIEREISPGCFDGAALAEEGEGEHVTMRDFLGEWYFGQLEMLGTLGTPEDVRIVFWFDS